MKKKKIMCINRNKITSAGKVSICVFDKTGTLTEDHLNIVGFVPIYSHSLKEDGNDKKINFFNNKYYFDKFCSSIKDLSNENYIYYKEKVKDPNKKTKEKELKQLFIECLACCQGITRIKGKLVGDPIDVEMFESTGWELIEDPEDNKNYDPKMLSFVRPKQEKSLTEKINNGKEEIKEHYEIGIIYRYDFSSKLQRMSIIAKNINDENYMCYCKGSPEKIRELCIQKTLPQNFNKKLNYYTSKGYRVLALACKTFKLNNNDSFEMSRDFYEKDLIFLGLLIVENKLKKPTKKTLRILNDIANVKNRMATGDNILTAICGGRKCNLIDPKRIIYSCEIEREIKENKNEEGINSDIDLGKTNVIRTNIYDNSLIKEIEKEKIKRKLVWKEIENFKDEKEEEKNDEKELNNEESIKTNDENGEEEDNEGFFLQPIKEENIEKDEENDENIEIDFSSLPFDKDAIEANIQIAITGKTFETLFRMNQKYEKSINKNKKPSTGKININDIDPLIPNNSNNDYASEDINKIIDYKNFHEAFRLILKYCSIYARCSPENKTQIVESLQKESLIVLMCGDGANDCGALKVADVGLSLSTEEASLAAPFTSAIQDISCVIEVLREGKCALVTSFQIFKYIILYSMIQFISVTFLILKDSYLSDFQFLAEDLFIITPLAFLMPLTPAYDIITFHKPDTSLFSFNIIFSMVVQTLLVAIFQIGSYFLMDFVFPNKDNDFENNFCKVDNKDCKNGDNFRFCTNFMNDYDNNCIDNTVLFYISFSQLLILCIAFAKGKPFKKSIFHNLWLFIFVILLFIYSEYIVFYVDKFTENYLEIKPFPDDSFTETHTNPKYILQFKYYVMIIIVLNFVISLFIEKVILPIAEKYWKKKRMKSLKNRVENDKENEATLNMINKVQNYVNENKINKNLESIN